MGENPKNRRRTVVVDGKLQARIVLSTSIPMVACLVFATVAEMFYRRQVALGHLRTDGTIFGMPDHQLGILLLFVSASMTQLVSALLSSQKIAGTAYRIARVLEAYRDGNRAARVTLRRGDYQTQLADDLNAFLDWSSSPDAPASSASAAMTGTTGSRTAAAPAAGNSRPAGTPTRPEVTRP